MTNPKYHIDQIVIVKAGSGYVQRKIIGASEDNGTWYYYAHEYSLQENGEAVYNMAEHEIVKALRPDGKWDANSSGPKISYA